MILGRIVLGLLGAALAAVLILALAAPEATSRGTDELVYAQFGQLAFDPGTSYDQPLRIQSGGLSRLSIPYHRDGGRPARVQVTVSEPGGGRVLLDRTVEAPVTRTWLGGLIPLGSDYWDSQQSGWLRLDLPASGQPSELEVHLRRADRNPDAFFFYTDPAVATRKAPLVQNPDIAIVIQTSYGPLRPALLKAPTYSARVASLAPPWFGGPLPALLLALLVLAGAAAVCACLQGPVSELPGPSRKLGHRDGDF